MKTTLSGHSTTLTGWGRTDPSTALLCSPSAVEQIQNAIATAGPGSLIARGLIGQATVVGKAKLREQLGAIGHCNKLTIPVCDTGPVVV